MAAVNHNRKVATRFGIIACLHKPSACGINWTFQALLLDKVMICQMDWSLGQLFLIVQPLHGPWRLDTIATSDLLILILVSSIVFAHTYTTNLYKTLIPLNPDNPLKSYIKDLWHSQILQSAFPTCLSQTFSPPRFSHNNGSHAQFPQPSHSALHILLLPLRHPRRITSISPWIRAKMYHCRRLLLGRRTHVSQRI